LTEKHEITTVTRDEKILGLLGLAAKAGRLLSGAEKLVDAARSGALNSQNGLIAVASDASVRTKKNIAIAADENEIKRVEVSVDMRELGRRTGGKGAASAVAVTDRNIAGAIKKLI
jgi:Ribosomal protein HS6-type (S12/L30/L7a)